MLNVELHAHTHYSKDSLLKPERLLEVCRKKLINRIVITDHNTIRGAVFAKNIDPELVIIGEEIMTTRGELLAFFVKEEIPALLDPNEVINRLRQQGAFISVSHPFDKQRSGSWKENDLLQILPHVDAIEIYNARSFKRVYNTQAMEFAQRHGIAGTVGSDSHAGFEVGKAYLTLPGFADAESFRSEFAYAKQTCSWSPPWVHFTSRYATWRKKLGTYHIE